MGRPGPSEQPGPRPTGGAQTPAGSPVANGDDAVADGDTTERDDLLASAVRRAVQETGAYAASVFLRSRDRSSIVLAATCGVPPSLLGGWRLIPVHSPIPVAAAYVSGRLVHLADADQTMRRFPQLSVAVPFAFGSASLPLRGGQETFGALAVVWAAPPGSKGLTKAERRRLRSTANRLGAALAALHARGDPVECDARTVAVELRAPGPSAVRVGLFDWDLEAGVVTADHGLCRLFGVDSREFDGRFGTLTARTAPGDLAALRAAVRGATAAAADDGRLLAHRLRVREEDGTQRTVELWGRVTDAAAGGTGPHVVGAVVDASAGATAVTAIERLAEGVLSVDPDGRLTYLNRGLERLLQIRREDVLGRRLWDVLPWLSDPAYENRYRAAMVSQQPTSFLACRPPDSWLAFSLHPDANGVTGRVVPGGQPTPPPAAPAASAERPRLDAMYHLLALGSALTEAVTARQVCEVVAHQLLPAFGGQQSAIHEVHEGRLRLISHTGHDERFLAWLEGSSLESGLPATDALTSGIPLFAESQQALRDSYPDIPADVAGARAYLPLIASSRPVGTCILGFDEVHHFPVEERSVLTALGGLIAQALERARLYDEESAIARGLQHALLPHRLPVLPHVRTTGRYLPCTRGMDIGGDWYDVLPAGRDIALVIGDVEGHSVAAAAAMGQLRSVVRAYASAGHRPSQVMASTNRLLMDLDAGLLASCCYLRLDSATGQLCAVRAGHCPPLLRHPDGTTEILELVGGALLGVEPGTAYPETRLDLAPGSVLALYTDGLVEERGTDIEVGIDHLRASLAHSGAASLEGLADQLLQGARRSANRADDIALLLAEYAPDRHPQDR